MIRFKLNDDFYDSNEKYFFDLNFSTRISFYNFMDNDFINFKKNMDSLYGKHNYFEGKKSDIDFIGYFSNEIKDFPTALEKWKEFFKSKNKLI